MKINLLHISDIHFNKHSGDAYDLDEQLRYQVELDCKKLVSELGDFSGILITGDVSYSATRDQFTKAEAWLRELCAILNCDPGNVWVTPGNHDVDRNIYTKSKSLKDTHSKIRSLELGEFETELLDILRDEVYQQSLYSPLKEYIAFAGRYSCQISPTDPCWTEVDNNKLKFPSGYILNLTGLNSVVVSNKLDDDSTNRLFIGEHQLHFDESPELIHITLCHHPVDWLIDNDNTQRILSLKTHLSLFGHKHEQWISPEEPGEARHVCVTAGAVHPERQNQQWLPRFNALTFKIEEGDNNFLNCKIYSRFYSNDDKQFIPEMDGTHEFKQYRIPLDKINETSTYIDTTKMKSDENDCGVEAGKSIPQAKLTKKELNFRFLSLQYHEIMKIGAELRLVTEDDRNGIKDYELTRRFIQRAEESKVFEELSKKVLSMYSENK